MQWHEGRLCKQQAARWDSPELSKPIAGFSALKITEGKGSHFITSDRTGSWSRHVSAGEQSQHRAQSQSLAPLRCEAKANGARDERGYRGLHFPLLSDLLLHNTRILTPSILQIPVSALRIASLHLCSRELGMEVPQGLGSTAQCSNDASASSTRLQKAGQIPGQRMPPMPHGTTSPG